MSKVLMRDMVIILPGITGSVLQKDGRDLWAPSRQAAWSILTSGGDVIQQLKLAGDDPNADNLGDGIVASAIVEDAHLVPGLIKIDGYTTLGDRIQQEFDVIPGNINDDRPANFFKFPYDWRRDNRVAARQLKKFIDERLDQWRKDNDDKNAKVILLAHSMGGLVSRYYTEVLGGWKDCRALVTFGTPHRGSPNALNFLVNGYKKLIFDLTDVMRSFTSIYQLLPIYELVESAGQYHRIAETDNIPNVDRLKAENALVFHREIEAAVNENLKNIEYRDNYKIIPVVGTRQKTFQSAVLAGGDLTLGWDLPSWIGADYLGYGDGTVPRISAIPIELSDEHRETYIAEKHGSLQNNKPTLDDLMERLKQMQAPVLGKIRGSDPATEKPSLSLEVDDLYLHSEPIKLSAEVFNSKYSGELEALIEPVNSDTEAKTVAFERYEEHRWRLTLDALPPGLYRVEVKPSEHGSGDLENVHDLFEVAPR